MSSTFKQKYPIIPRYLTGPSLRRPCKTVDVCRFLVAHDVGNPGSTAAGNVGYYERSRNEQEASAHIFVDDREIIECIPFLTAPPEKAWHVIYDAPTDNQMFGDDANDVAGGVELCYGGGMDLYEAYKRYVWVLAYSCYKYGLDPAQHITGHYILDPARKVDPLNALQLLGKSFEDLICDIVNEYNDCLQPEEDNLMKLELTQWRMMGDAITGLSQLPGGPNGDPLISYDWAEQCYAQELKLEDAICILFVTLARSKGIEVAPRE